MQLHTMLVRFFLLAAVVESFQSPLTGPQKYRLSSSYSKDTWNDEHLTHGISNLHEESNEELLESERAAAWDAHDAPDAGMEAAAEERAVMLAAEIVHKMKEKADGKTGPVPNKWNEEHLAHSIAEIHEETAEELLESEIAAAWDAHDALDAGMEAAAEERAVMLAAEMMHKLKEGKKENAAKKWSQEHLAHSLAEVHEEDAEELLESEIAAAWDAHDAPDAGMEAAAEERAVMLAAEMMHRMKEKKAKGQKAK